LADFGLAVRAPLPKVSGEASASVLDGRVIALDLMVQLDQACLDGSPLGLFRMLFQRPRNLDSTASILTLAEVRGGVVTTVRAFDQPGLPPVEIEAGGVALTSPR
jgi:hypothetical protein